MRIIVLLSILISICFTSFAQDGSNITFGIGEKVMVDYAIVDAQDNLIASGNYRKDHIESDLIIESRRFVVPKEGASFIVKFNPEKSVQWFHYIRSYNTPEITLLSDDSSNVYMIGVYERFLDFDGKSTFLGGLDKEIFVAKYTATGQLKWIKRFGSISDESIGKPTIDKDGNLFIVGRFQGNFQAEGNNSIVDMDGWRKSFLLKLDRNGKLVWIHKFDDTGIIVNAVEVNRQSKIFISGTFSESRDFGACNILTSKGEDDVFYAQCEQNGGIIWVKQIGGIATDRCNDITLDNYGYVFVSGQSSDNAGQRSIFLLKASETDGVTVWSNSVTTNTDKLPDFLLVNDLTVNKAGEPYLLGFAEGTELTFNDKIKLSQPNQRFIFLAKYSADGKVSYVDKESIFDQFGYATSMALDSRNNIFLTNFYNFNNFTYSILKRKTELDIQNCTSTSVIIANQESCAGQAMKLSENVIIPHNDFAFQWYKDGEIIRRATEPSYQAMEEGYYSLKLINKADKSCEVKSANNVLVSSKELYAHRTTDIVFHYDPDNYRLSTNSDTDQWYQDNQLINVQGNMLTNPPDGVYKIKRTVPGCSVTVESKEIIIQDGYGIELHKETIDGLGNHCEPFPYFRISTNITGEGLLYRWFLNDQLIPDSTETHLMAVASGDYHASIINLNTGKVYASRKYRLDRKDYLQALPLSKVDNGCGTAAVIKIDDAFATKYLIEDITWKLNGQELPNEKNLFIRATASGDYTSSVRYTTFYSEKTSCNYNSFTHFEKKPDFNVNIGYGYAGSGCKVDSFKVFVEANQAYKYQWARNDTLLNNQTSNELFVKDKSIYRAYVDRGDGCIKETDEISLSGCASDAFAQFVMLNPPVISAEKKTILANEKSFIKAEGCTDVNFQWLKDEIPLTGANEPALELRQTGSYALQIEKFGCKNVSNTIDIIVESILSEEGTAEIEIRAFPNPATETLQIVIPVASVGNSSITLQNSKGETLRKASFTQTTTINLKDLSEGVYLLTIETDKQRFVKKIVKK
ncbi:T9SS type A sorting domain-containing protein [Emticicia sp. BO119]|uniref:T9SS type A sorting domain-containing protein n=1 Tax=Emticicia sp. BO119 TaxID=2757768 RepID=UPI0015F09174|nr:T9SS type A sorting domain-containing protein [Emticicia sp. BO119]MBA4851481.1 T9SS type A sorting domain-containing protein [Emticicia sp. BO119]